MSAKNAFVANIMKHFAPTHHVLPFFLLRLAFSVEGRVWTLDCSFNYFSCKKTKSWQITIILPKMLPIIN